MRMGGWRPRWWGRTGRLRCWWGIPARLLGMGLPCRGRSGCAGGSRGWRLSGRLSWPAVWVRLGCGLPGWPRRWLRSTARGIRMRCWRLSSGLTWRCGTGTSGRRSGCTSGRRTSAPPRRAAGGAGAGSAQRGGLLGPVGWAAGGVRGGVRARPPACAGRPAAGPAGGRGAGSAGRAAVSTPALSGPGFGGTASRRSSTRGRPAAQALVGPARRAALVGSSPGRRRFSAGCAAR